MTISIPSTLASTEGRGVGPSPAERAAQRLRDERREFARCPTCGGRAWVDACDVHRPGHPSVHRVTLRCAAPAKRNGRGQAVAKCPVHVTDTPLAGAFPVDLALAPAPPPTDPDPPEVTNDQHDLEPEPQHEDQLPAAPAPAEPEEESMPTTTRACATCGASIDHRPHLARYCEDCATERRLASARESRRLRSAARAVEPEPTPAAESALAPAPSRALRVSVLDLAQQLRTLHPDARALLLDVCALSPERQALLRTVLADAEGVA